MGNPSMLAAFSRTAYFADRLKASGQISAIQNLSTFLAVRSPETLDVPQHPKLEALIPKP